MKAYTDLDQSKKLAKILPIESADMRWYYKYNEGDKPQLDICNGSRYYIPCWSLAALFEVLPTIDDGNRNPVFCKDIRFNKWHIVYHGTAIEPTIDSGLYDNPIDACVEMIYKLKERDLL